MRILNSSRRRAFTLVELTFVIAIIGTLAALLLPAIMRSREAARRAVCQRNLAQVGLALANYHSVHGSLPPGSINPAGPVVNAPVGYHFNWIVQILPQLDEANLYRSFDFTIGVYALGHLDERQRRVEVLLCPSSSLANPYGTNYVGCHHDSEAPIDAHNNGTLYLNSRVSWSDIDDGRKHTLLVGETSDSTALGWASGTRATLRNPTGSLRPADYEEFGFDGEQSASDVFAGLEPDLGLIPVNLLEEDDIFEVDLDIEKQEQPELAARRLLVGGFNSAHPGGAHFAFADSSVRFVADTVSLPVIRAWAHRSDGALPAEF